MSTLPRPVTDYTVACICPMGVELAPVEAMLDEVHDPLPTRGHNVYTLGKIGNHYVVVAVMPEIGNNAAATLATQLMNDFPATRFGLLVGIGGGVPGTADVRLGDVVVGQATDDLGGVVQYDRGKILEEGRWQKTGYLNKPPAVLSASVRKLESQHRRQGNQLARLVLQMTRKFPKMSPDYSFPATAGDHLFLTSYTHQPGNDCVQCDHRQTVPRPPRPDNDPQIHYGTIGSANVVVKDAVLRDELQKDVSALCVEMEAAGLMDNFPCLVIRGICDYADSHKNKRWQPYAAAVAAAYAKELLLTVPAQQMVETSGVSPTTASYSDVPQRMSDNNESRENDFLHRESQLNTWNTRMAQSSTYRVEGNDNRRFLRAVGFCFAEAPRMETDLFVGRDSEIQRMAELVQTARRSNQQRRIVLGGVGGVGKTQLAIAFAQHHHKMFDSVIWLNATSEATLKASLRNVAERIFTLQDYRALDSDLILVHFKGWLADTDNTKWLVIFDNYDEPQSYDITHYYPYTLYGTVVVTTRLPDQVSGQRILVLPLRSLDHSLYILETRSGRSKIADDPHAQSLAKRLAGLPLALATVAAYLQKSTFSFEQYLQTYEDQWNVSPHRSVQLHEYQDRTLFTTWDMTFTHLERREPDVAQLLKLLAYFDHQALWYALLSAGAQGNTSDLSKGVQAILSSETNFDSAMRVLVDYCLVEVQLTQQTYSIHTCIHDWTLARLNATVEARNYWYAFDRLSYVLRQEDSDSLMAARFARLIPHALRLTKSNFNGIARNISEIRLEGAEYIAALLRYHSHHLPARLMLERVLSCHEALYGGDHASTLRMVRKLGNVYYEEGDLEEAEKMATRALAKAEKLYSQEDLSTLSLLHLLGRVHGRQQKFEEAEKLCVQALTGATKLFGTDSRLTLNIVHDLGILYSEQDRLNDAEQMFMQALNGRIKVYGPDHPFTLDTIASIGSIYYMQDKLEDAERMYHQALTGMAERLGSQHDSTLTVVHNLGLVHERQGKLADAEEMYTRALTGFKETFETDDPKVLRVTKDLEDLYALKTEQDTMKSARQDELSSMFDTLDDKPYSASLPSDDLWKLDLETRVPPNIGLQVDRGHRGKRSRGRSRRRRAGASQEHP